MTASGSTGALEQLRAAVDALGKCDLAALDDHQLVRFARELEVQRNRLAVVDHRLVAAVETRPLADRLLARDSAGVLAQTLSLTRSEGRRRMLAAAELGERTTMTGEVLPTRYPRLAEVEASGLLGREHRDIALWCLRCLQHRFGAPEEVLSRADRSLAHYATDLDPDGFRRVARHILDVEFPGGLLPDDERVAAARELLLRGRRDGSYALTGTLTGECGSKLAAILDTLSRPVPHPGENVQDLERSEGDRIGRPADLSADPAGRDLRT